MKKKIFAGVIVGALISATLTLGLVCLLLGINSTNALDLGRFFVALRFIEGNYVQAVDRRNLIDGAISGMVNSLGDPHSIYLAPQLYSQLRAETSGAFGGIGVYMGFKNGGVQVMSVIPDGPGQRAGLQAGDEILAVDGQPVTEISPAEVALKIRGQIGTPVELLIHREGFDDTTYNLTRENIHVKTVAGKMIDDRLGYIKISNFSENTGDEFKETLAELEKAGMKGFILDLRQNPGGVITGCIEIAEQLVPAGTIASVIKRDGSKEVYTSDLAAAKFPIVVLIDHNSASELRTATTGFNLSVEYLDFGNHFNTLTFKIINASATTPMSWEIFESLNWLTVTPNTGNLQGGQEVTLTVTIDRTLIHQNTTGNITIHTADMEKILPVSVSL